MPWRWIKYAYRSLKLWRLLDKLRKGKGGITETGNYGNGKGNGKGNGELRKRKGKRKGKRGITETERETERETTRKQ